MSRAAARQRAMSARAERKLWLCSRSGRGWRAVRTGGTQAECIERPKRAERARGRAATRGKRGGIAGPAGAETPERRGRRGSTQAAPNSSELDSGGSRRSPTTDAHLATANWRMGRGSRGRASENAWAASARPALRRQGLRGSSGRSTVRRQRHRGAGPGRGREVPGRAAGVGQTRGKAGEGPERRGGKARTSKTSPSDVAATRRRCFAPSAWQPQTGVLWTRRPGGRGQATDRDCGRGLPVTRRGPSARSGAQSRGGWRAARPFVCGPRAWPHGKGGSACGPSEGS